MRLLSSAFAVLREYWKPYAALNGLYYGLVLFGMLISLAAPEIQESLRKLVIEAYGGGLLGIVTDAYKSGNVLLAALLTFAVNFFLGTILQLRVPSLIVPFSGLLVACFRALVWGLMFAPNTPEDVEILIPHSLTLLIEGQGYVLAMLGIYIHGKAFLFPHSVSASSHFSGYCAGVRVSGRLLVLIAVVLAVAAVYEAFEAIYIVGF